MNLETRDIHEKRYNRNLKRYKEYNNNELSKLEKQRIDHIYSGLPIDKSIDAEMYAIRIQLEKDEKVTDRFKMDVEEIINRQTGNYNEDIKKIITVIQLALNISPVFLSKISELYEDGLYITIEQFINQKRKFIRR